MKKKDIPTKTVSKDLKVTVFDVSGYDAEIKFVDDAKAMLISDGNLTALSIIHNGVQLTFDGDDIIKLFEDLHASEGSANADKI